MSVGKRVLCENGFCRIWYSRCVGRWKVYLKNAGIIMNREKKCRWDPVQPLKKTNVPVFSRNCVKSVVGLKGIVRIWTHFSSQSQHTHSSSTYAIEILQAPRSPSQATILTYNLRTYYNPLPSVRETDFMKRCETWWFEKHLRRRVSK